MVGIESKAAIMGAALFCVGLFVSIGTTRTSVGLGPAAQDTPSQARGGGQTVGHGVDVLGDTDTGASLPALYLDTVRMGLLGGLTHEAEADPEWGGTTDYVRRNQCLTKHRGERDPTRLQHVDICIIKWDGFERLERIAQLYAKIRLQGVPGDLVECGVWRGGVVVYMAALARAYKDVDRERRGVWVVDSFQGVPDKTMQDSRKEEVPEDLHRRDVNHWGGHTKIAGVMSNILTVQEAAVRDNFKRFGLLGPNVNFVKGWFNDTLPHAGTFGMKQISLLRVDGDLYTSTMDVLVNLFPMLSPGGWLVFDDWPLNPSRGAVEDFFKKEGLDFNSIRTDRLTPELPPTEEALREERHQQVRQQVRQKRKDINKYGYWQKPFTP